MPDFRVVLTDETLQGGIDSHESAPVNIFCGTFLLVVNW